jgi:competence protein ComGC
MKKIKVILIVFWISILLMVLISATSSQPSTQQKDTIATQDTVKKKVDVKQSDMDRKKAEYLEWQRRSMKLDKSNEKLDRQTMLLDSLLGKKDTTKIRK